MRMRTTPNHIILLNPHPSDYKKRNKKDKRKYCRGSHLDDLLSAINKRQEDRRPYHHLLPAAFPLSQLLAVPVCP